MHNTPKWRACPYGGAHYLERPHPKNPRAVQRLAQIEKSQSVGYRVEIDGVCIGRGLSLIEAKKAATDYLKQTKGN